MANQSGGKSKKPDYIKKQEAFRRHFSKKYSLFDFIIMVSASSPEGMEKLYSWTTDEIIDYYLTTLLNG